MDLVIACQGGTWMLGAVGFGQLPVGLWATKRILGPSTLIHNSVL